MPTTVFGADGTGAWPSRTALPVWDKSGRPAGPPSMPACASGSPIVDAGGAGATGCGGISSGGAFGSGGGSSAAATPDVPSTPQIASDPAQAIRASRVMGSI